MIAEQAEHDPRRRRGRRGVRGKRRSARAQDLHALRRRDARRRSGGGDGKCFRCGGIGHWARDCPKKAKTAPSRGCRAGRAADVPRQKGPEVRPHEAVDVAQRKNPNRDYYKCPSAPASSGSRAVNRVVAEEWGRTKRSSPCRTRTASSAVLPGTGRAYNPVSLDPSRRWRDKRGRRIPHRPPCEKGRRAR